MIYLCFFRPFVPQADPAFNDLQRQVQLLETLPAAPIRPTRLVLVIVAFHPLIKNTQENSPADTRQGNGGEI